jgi:hypothetical protein
VKSIPNGIPLMAKRTSPGTIRIKENIKYQYRFDRISIFMIFPP